MTLKRLCVVLFVLIFIHGCSAWNQPSRKEINELRGRLEQQNVGEIVRAIYTERGFRPIWTLHGRKQPKLGQFFQLVGDRSHGLKPEAFGIQGLRTDDGSEPIQFDINVTAALVKYATALARKDADINNEVRAAIESNSILQLPERLAPKHPQYAKLRSALQNASAADRHRIALNMDRWRKLPDDLGERYIQVNIPAFELEVHDGDHIPLKMKVVVGSNDNKTPIFDSEMKTVVFSPYWNIPQTILAKETLPKIQADPSYTIKQQLEVVKVSGKRVEIIDPRDVDWDHVGPNDIQVRQKPGKANSLGLVKFLFPNPYDVYLHDTPADNLFDRLTRNLSHGCVRLEKSEELAQYVLRDQPEWTPERIHTAMHAGEEKSVALKHPIPVHIVYFTAWVDDGGALHFEKDIYGYDTREPGSVLD